MRPLNRPMFKMGGPIKEGIMDGMREPLKNGGLSKQFNTGLVGDERYPKTGGREHHYLNLIPMGLQALRVFGRIKDLARVNKGIGLPMATRPESVGFRIGSFAKQNPFLTLSTPSLATSAVTGGGPLAIEAAKGVANFLVPGQRFDPFRDKMPEKKEGDTTELKRSTKEELEGADTTTNVTEDPNKRKQIDEDRIAKTKKRYYELMGIDKMKKDAAYDSLIDASRIVSEQGGDLKGAIRSGTLQSSIINAISKNLDKSADIKRQIDAAILKGEIQKDIASADTTDKEYKKARTKQLQQATSATGQIAAVIADKGTILGDQTASILRASNIKYDDVIQDKLFNNFKKDNPGADEIDFMIAKGAGLDDGRYVIRGRLVEKKGPNVAFIV